MIRVSVEADPANALGGPEFEHRGLALGGFAQAAGLVGQLLVSMHHFNTVNWQIDYNRSTMFRSSLILG